MIRVKKEKVNKSNELSFFSFSFSAAFREARKQARTKKGKGCPRVERIEIDRTEQIWGRF